MNSPPLFRLTLDVPPEGLSDKEILMLERAMAMLPGARLRAIGELKLEIESTFTLAEVSHALYKSGWVTRHAEG